jgi:ubiquinone/menaquinone biosynthesis C-methylase UbiE
MADLIDQLGLLREGDRVLDVGCGTGVMAAELANRLGASGKYLGFDVHRPSIDWCLNRFPNDGRFTFTLADVDSPYGSVSRSVEKYRFPAEDAEVDLVIAKSLFTHLMEREARHYLREIGRTLNPGRPAIVTAFLFEKGSLIDRGQSPLFPYTDNRGVLRWRWRARPASAIAYERQYFTQMINDVGLREQWFCQGFWPGDSRSFVGQDVLVLGS